MHSKGISIRIAIAYTRIRVFVLVVMAANPLDRTILFSVQPSILRNIACAGELVGVTGHHYYLADSIRDSFE